MTALVPIKSISERVLNKNIRPFNGKPLFQWILETLQSSLLIDEILINTDSDQVKTFVSSNISKAKIIERPEKLSGNMVTMNSIINYDIEQTHSDHFLQTHATNPLLTLRTIEMAIQVYFSSLQIHDSLFSVTKFQNRFYDQFGTPVNHTKELMLRTQDLDPIFEENSNLFIFSRSSFKKAGNSRIGLRPQLFSMNKIESIDIDYEEDFLLAELVHQNRSHFKGIFV